MGGTAGVERPPAAAAAQTDGLSASEEELLDIIATRRAFDDVFGDQLEGYLEEHHAPEEFDPDEQDVGEGGVRGLGGVEDTDSEPDESDIVERFSEYPHLDYAGSGLDTDELLAIIEYDDDHGIPRLPFEEFAAYADAKTAFATGGDDGNGWKDVLEQAGVDVDDYRPTSLATSGLGSYLALGRHVAVQSAESIHREWRRLETVEAHSDDKSGPDSLLLESMFEGHTITHPTAHDAYDDLLPRPSASASTDFESSFGEDEDGSSGARRGRRNEFYEQTITGLTGMEVGERGPNPLGDSGASSNYFIVLDRDFAFDHKHEKISYTPLSYMACMVGVRPPHDPEGEFTAEEQLHTWVRIKDPTTILSDDAKVPMALFNEAAIELGTASSEDIQPVEHEPKDRESWSRDEIVDDEKWNATVDAFAEEYGIDSNIRKKIVQDDLLVNGLTKEDSIQVFAEQHMTEGIEVDDANEENAPRVKSRVAFAAYQQFCRLNDTESKHNSDINEIVEAAEASKERRRFGGPKRSWIIGSTLTDSGWELWEQSPESSED
ncbi:hypothetical protein [Halobaculum litoreum]|nr:hypothetical protein [Halobaculum sp. DT92]